jgi:low affinity Fe/Cu permease
MAAGLAVIESSKVQNLLSSYKHSVDILEELYESTRNTVNDVLTESSKTMNHVDKMIEDCEKIIDFNREIIEDHNKIRHDISMLQIRLEDEDDSTEA